MALETQLAEGRADQAQARRAGGAVRRAGEPGNRIETTAAQVIANGVSNFEWTITIDKGSSVGISVGMPVVSSAGLVGHVRVGTSSSVVQLIIDPDSSVAGRLDVAPDRVSRLGASDLQMSLSDRPSMSPPTSTSSRPAIGSPASPRACTHRTSSSDGLAGAGRGLGHREAPHGSAGRRLLLAVPRARGAFLVTSEGRVVIRAARAPALGGHPDRADPPDHGVPRSTCSAPSPS